jgi:thiamine transport system ATP-binding protein
MSDLDVTDVAVRFGDRTVLDGVDLHVGHASVVALLGSSGSGKSTLLRVIAGILAPDRGAIHIAGRDVTAVPTHRRGVGMVFQDNQLFPHRSVGENLAFGLKMAGRPKSERTATVAEWLDRIGLTGMANARATTLSGGEAKRVALARTLVPGPEVVLLDEPLTGLDADLHDRLAEDLAGLLRATATTAVLVTHDRAEADAIADHIIELSSINRVRR